MNKELAEAIEVYTKGGNSAFGNYLLDKSKNNLIAIITDLLTMYINDKNSSMLREYITVITAGYEHTEQKIGYNGYKQSSVLGGRPINCEAKPKNFDTEQLQKYFRKERKTKPSLLDGGGSFNDYTWNRFTKDKESNLNILVSGFVDGKLIYIFEFTFMCSSFTANIQNQLKKRLPEGDRPNQYLRGASFNYKHFKDCNNLNSMFLLAGDKLEEYQKYINKGFYEFLLERVRDG